MGYNFYELAINFYEGDRRGEIIRNILFGFRLDDVIELSKNKKNSFYCILISMKKSFQVKHNLQY